MAEHSGSAWFEVDPKGLKRILARRGPEFVLYELLANAWDEPGVSRVDVEFHLDKMVPPAGRRWLLRVTDDAPQGFTDLTHAYTMFAPSKKVDDVEQRGRFNLGEKLVLAYADVGWVKTQQGTILFAQNGQRKFDPDDKRERGTEVALLMTLTERQTRELNVAAGLILPPDKVLTTWNGDVLARPTRVGEAIGTLPTEVAGDDGNLKPTRRQTAIQLFSPGLDQAWLFEMGVPVCELDMPWHVNVLQKVPLALDRESVRPAYFKALYVAVLNECYALLTTKEQATEAWVRTAAGHGDCSEAAIKHLTRVRFGDNVVSYDPSDPEANARAMAAGATVVHGGALSKGEWGNIKAIGAIKPAGQVHGTPRPFAFPDGSPEQKELQWVPEAKRTVEQQTLVLYVTMLAAQLLRKPITVLLADDRRWLTERGTAVRACYGQETMILNWRYVGHGIPRDPEDLHHLILHELAHEFSPNHLDDAYHDGLATLGARLAILVATRPEPYAQWLRKDG